MSRKNVTKEKKKKLSPRLWGRFHSAKLRLTDTLKKLKGARHGVFFVTKEGK